MKPVRTAWKSVPGPASCSCPAGPIQYTVPPRGSGCGRQASDRWRLPSRVTSKPAISLPGQVGHVDVEDGVGGQRIGFQPGHDFDRGARGGREIAGLVVGGRQRHRHRGQAEETPFHRRRHGAGIDHVVAQVGGVVDARHDDIGLHLQHPGQGQMHAIGGRAGDTPGLLVELLDPDRQIKGERIAGPGTVSVGSDHQDFMARGAQALGEGSDARRVNAVVIAYQYAHGVPQWRLHDTAGGCRLPPSIPVPYGNRIGSRALTLVSRHPPGLHAIRMTPA